MAFRFTSSDIPEVVLVDPSVFSDERGFLIESYKRSEFAAFGITEPFVQSNHSKSRKGILRGLHYQKNPKPQAKLVRALVRSARDCPRRIRALRNLGRAHGARVRSGSLSPALPLRKTEARSSATAATPA